MWGVLLETEGDRARRILDRVLIVPVLFSLNVFPPTFSLWVSGFCWKDVSLCAWTHVFAFGMLFGQFPVSFIVGVPL